MTTVTLERAEKELATLIERARAGEEIVIVTAGRESVRLQVVAADMDAKSTPGYRGRGILKGKMQCPPDSAFFDSLPQDELKLWWGEDT